MFTEPRWLPRATDRKTESTVLVREFVRKPDQWRADAAIWLA